MSVRGRKSAGPGRRSTAPAPSRASVARSRKGAPAARVVRSAEPPDVDTVRLLRELAQHRAAVARAMEQLHESWVRVRDWDEQLGYTQAALMEAHSRFGEFYDLVPTPFAVLDDRLRITQANAAAAALLDGSRPLVGRPIVAFVAQEQLRPLLAMLTDAAPDETKRLQLRVRSRNGWVPAQLTARVCERLTDGEPRRVYSIALVDLSDVRRVEQQHRRSADAERAAIAAAHAKAEFIALLSHELRTPLTPILAAADALSDVELPAPAREVVAIIRRNAATEARLVDDLLDAARVTQRQLPVETLPLSVHSLVGVVVADWAPEATEGGLEVRIELGATQDRVEGDPDRLAQVLRNVLGNALKFTDPGGRVMVRTTDADAYLRLCIEDTGRGMTPAEVARLFEPFGESRQQVHSRAGLGLGLVISHGIVEAHGGRIRVRSRGRGLGTTVEIDLPNTDKPLVFAETPLSAESNPPNTGAEAGQPAAPDQERPRPTAPQPRRRDAHRVLLVEDHADSAETLSMVLAMKGYDVQVARTLQQAESLVDDCDVLVSDISLPDGSGLDLMRRAQLRRPLPAIALSGYGTDEDRERSREAGFAEHLTKPVDVDRLLAAVQRLAAAP